MSDDLSISEVQPVDRLPLSLGLHHLIRTVDRTPPVLHQDEKNAVVILGGVLRELDLVEDAPVYRLVKIIVQVCDTLWSTMLGLRS